MSNKYTIATRIAMLENFATEIRKEISAIQLKEGKPGSRGCDGARGQKGDPGLHGKDGAAGKDSSVPGPAGCAGRQGERGARGEKGEQGIQGLPGKDGVSITGPAGSQGEKGDVLILSETELAQAVLDLRRKLKQQHAAHIAVIVESIEGQKKGNHSSQHFARLLESIKADIERLARD